MNLFFINIFMFLKSCSNIVVILEVNFKYGWGLPHIPVHCSQESCASCPEVNRGLQSPRTIPFSNYWRVTFAINFWSSKYFSACYFPLKPSRYVYNFWTKIYKSLSFASILGRTSEFDICTNILFWVSGLYKESL